MVNFGDALRKGLVFAIEPKRWLPLFILDVSFLGVFFVMFFPVVQEIMLNMAMNGAASPLAWLPLAGYIMGLILLGILWYILRLWITGSLIHQSCRPLEIRKAYEISISRLHKLIAVTLLVGIISGIFSAALSVVPLMGSLAGVFIGIAFFFILQGIIIDDLGIISTLKSSWKTFRKSPFDVFVAWLLIAIVTGLIALLFALPLICMLAGFFMNSVFPGVISGSGSDAATIAMLMMYVETNLGAIAAFGLVALVGFELSQVFSLKAQTEFYMQFRKRFPAIIKTFSDKTGRFF
jgi:hypothetical protein